MDVSTTLPISHYYESQRLQIHYLDWGNDSAPPLLLVHGGRDHARTWDWVVAALRERFHILAVDLRGHGDSQWTNGPYGLDEFVLDIGELIHQKNLAPLKIMGHSLGGVISLRYTGIYPDNVLKLVAIEGLGRRRVDQSSTPISERYQNWIDKMREIASRTPTPQNSIETAVARMREANSHLSHEQAEHLTFHGLKQNEDGTYNWKFDTYTYGRLMLPGSFGGEDREKLWEQITCPTLLVHGADSWATDPEETGDLKYFNNAKRVMFEDAGHWVHHDQLEGVVKLVGEFLDD